MNLLRYHVALIMWKMEEKGIPVGNASFPMERYTSEQKKKIMAELVAAGLEC